MSNCMKCGGLIAEPGKAYGYAGQWCACPVRQPQTQQLAPLYGWVCPQCQKSNSPMVQSCSCSNFSGSIKKDSLAKPKAEGA